MGTQGRALVYIVHINPDSLPFVTDLFGREKEIKTRPTTEIDHCLTLVSLFSRLNDLGGSSTNLFQLCNCQWIATAQAQIGLLGDVHQLIFAVAKCGGHFAPILAGDTTIGSEAVMLLDLLVYLLCFHGYWYFWQTISVLDLLKCYS